MKFLKLIFALGLAMSISLFSCSDDEEKFTVPEENIVEPTPEITEDQMKVTSDLLTYVFPGEYDEVSECILNRMSNKTTVLTEDVKTVILHNSSISKLQEKDYVDLLEVYANGGNILVVEPTITKWNEFVKDMTDVIDTMTTAYPQGLYENIYAMVEAEDNFKQSSENKTIYVSDGGEKDLDEHFYDAIGLRSNDTYYIVDLYDKDGVHTEVNLETDQEGNTGEIEEKDMDFDEMTEYEYGNIADCAVNWLNKQKIKSEKHRNVLLSRGSGEVDLVKLSQAQNFTYTMVCSSPKIDNLQQRQVTGEVHYDIWTFNDLKTHEDYYLIHEAITQHNGELKCESEKDEKWMTSSYEGKKGLKFYGPYMDYIMSEPELQLTNGSSGTVSLSNVSPTTTESSSSTTTALSVNFNGQAGYGIAAVGTGIDFSESWTSNTNDLVIRYNGKGACPTWKYSVNDAKCYEYWFWVYHTLAPMISKNTCIVNNSWIWKVKNPKGKFTLKSRVTYLSQYLQLEDGAFSYSYRYPSTGLIYTHHCTLNPPPRYQKDYKLIVFAEEGDEQIEHYIRDNYPSLWKDMLPMATVTENDINPAKNYVKEFISVIQNDKARWIRDKKFGKFRMEIHDSHSPNAVYSQTFEVR